MGIGRFTRQVMRQVGREKRLSLGSFLVLIIVLILLDLFWIASINLNHQYSQLLRTVRMEAFLSEALPDSSLAIVKDALLSFDGVAQLDFISKEEAASILESDLGYGLLSELDENPLPPSFILHFDRAFGLAELDTIQSRISRLEGVEGIEYGRPWIQKLENIGSNLRRAMYIVGSIILFVVLLTMANTNRLTARGKSGDFFQLRLLGAGPTYLIYPFLAEGFLSAFGAAWLGWAAIFYGTGKITFSNFSLLLPEPLHILLYSLIAGLTGMAGAYLGIRKFLVER